MTKEDNINSTIEALILAAPEPVSVRKICEVVEDVSPARVRQAIGDLNNIYLGCGNSFRIRELAGGYQMYILPDFETPIKRLLSKQRTVRLSRPALETLAIIAYKQPVTKIDIEHIRGVASDGVIHNLLQRKLIVMAGRTSAAGRPLLYKTSDEFLKFFGLNRLSDLPTMEEIEEMIRQSDTPKEQTLLALTHDETPLLAESSETEAENEQKFPVVDGGNGSNGDNPDLIPAEDENRVKKSTVLNLPDNLFENYDPIPDEPPEVVFVKSQPSTDEKELPELIDDAEATPTVDDDESVVVPPLEVEDSVEEFGVKLPAATFEADEPVVAEPHSPSDESSPELPAEPTNAEGETLDPTGTADN